MDSSVRVQPKQDSMERSLVLWIAALLLRGISSTPLDDYVNAPDSHYKYEEVAQPFEGDGYMTYFLNMTSQKWLNGRRPSTACFVHISMSLNGVHSCSKVFMCVTHLHSCSMIFMCVTHLHSCSMVFVCVTRLHSCSMVFMCVTRLHSCSTVFMCVTYLDYSYMLNFFYFLFFFYAELTTKFFDNNITTCSNTVH